jgi:hypothetical protein
MRIGGIFGAIVGGIAGALVWGLIAKFLNIEVGYVAWAVGLAVGFLSYAMGGRGVANGILCAIVALAAIYGGKVLAIKWSATPEAMLAEMPTDGEFAGLSEAEKSELAKTVAESIDWKEASELATENLDIIDIIFAILGIGTAFKLGAAPRESETTAASMPMSPIHDVKPPGPAPDAPPPVAPAVVPQAMEPAMPETLPEEEKKEP